MSKGGVVKPKRRSRNVGLPKSAIQNYGEPIEWNMVSSKTWDAFYQTEQGKRMALEAGQREQGRKQKLLAKKATYGASNPRAANLNYDEANIQAKINAGKVKVKRERPVAPPGDDLGGEPRALQRAQEEIIADLQRQIAEERRLRGMQIDQ